MEGLRNLFFVSCLCMYIEYNYLVLCIYVMLFFMMNKDLRTFTSTILLLIWKILEVQGNCRKMLLIKNIVLSCQQNKYILA